MRLARLRAGERLALAGAVALLALLGLRWFGVSTPEADLRANESGIRSLGWFAVLLLLLAAGLAIATAVTSLNRQASALPVVLSALATAFGILATLAVAVRLVLQPGLGIGAGNADVEVLLPAVLGLLSCAAIATGAWMAMADERTEATESREQTRRVVPPPRAVPPPDAGADPAPS